MNSGLTEKNECYQKSPMSAFDRNIMQDVCDVMRQNPGINPELVHQLVSQLERYQDALYLTMHELDERLHVLRSNLTDPDQFASCTHMIALLRQSPDKPSNGQTTTHRAENDIMKSNTHKTSPPEVKPDPVGFVQISCAKARDRFKEFSNTLSAWDHCAESTSNTDDALREFIKKIGGDRPEAFSVPLKRLVTTTHSDKSEQNHSVQCALALASYVLGEPPVELQNRVEPNVLYKLQEIHDAYVYDVKQDFGISD